MAEQDAVGLRDRWLVSRRAASVEAEMARSVEVSGASFVYRFYAASLAIVPVVAHGVVFPVDDAGSVFAAAALVALVTVVVADGWYWRSGGCKRSVDCPAEKTTRKTRTKRTDGSRSLCRRSQSLATLTRRSLRSLLANQ